MTTEAKKVSLNIKKLARLLFDDWWQKYVPPRFQSVGTHVLSPQTLEKAQESATSLWSVDPKGLFLLGPVGTGKTSLLYLIQKMYMIARIEGQLKLEEKANGDISEYAGKVKEQNWLSKISPWIMTHGEVIKDLRIATENDNIHNSRAHIAEILMIDDFGRGYDDRSGWNTALQFEFIDRRWRECKPTFVTSNLTPKELRELGPEWQGTVDRLSDPAWMTAYTLGGERKRKGT